ncbi:MAG: flavin reductase family protein [Deltaproteobacteria bacterium]|nr:flavin reductase family protein [Deltaproteobacteria bacterium]
MEKKKFDFVGNDMAALPLRERHQLLLSAVAPRPIALAATMDDKGRCNLSPFSFFNAFGANPAYVAFSPAFGGKTGAPKHTLLNIQQTKEFTISVVSYDMVEQQNLASSEYPAGVDEFVKAGFTKHPSVRIKVPGVADSPCILECKLFKHIDLGGKPASGNLLIGEVVYMHLRAELMEASGKLDPRKLDQVSRMGGNWYSRAREGLFELPKPSSKGLGIGFDRLPREILESPVLTGNELAKLASVFEAPPAGDHSEYARESSRESVHLLIQKNIRAGDIAAAWTGIHFLELLK